MTTIGSLFEFLARLNTDERRRFDAAARAIKATKGQTVIGQGPGSTDVYFVEDGAFRVLIYSKSGKQVSIRTLRRGDCFGELAAIDQRERSANVVAVTDGRLLQVSGAVFKSILEGSSRAAIWLAIHLGGQVRVLTERIFELSALNVPSRLHCELLRLGLQAGVHDNESRIRPAPTHSELANRIGTHREGVTREMRALVRRGILQQSKRDLVLRDVAELSRLVQNAIGDHSRLAPPRSSGGAAPPPLAPTSSGMP
ncbi:MAG: cyclic nucleotide-binding domain-containing protein [Alphaproteobacteria bacterium]|nr:cyclic nucleotide-binding domain-containing protein [Alphaproteobacteria bacterium]